MPRGPSLQLNEHESHTSVISHKCHHTDSWSLDRFQTAVHCCRGRRYYLGSPCPASQGQPGTFRGGEGKKKDTAGEIQSMYFRIGVKSVFSLQKDAGKTGDLPCGSAMSCGILAGTGGVTDCTSPLAFTSYSLSLSQMSFSFSHLI